MIKNFNSLALMLALSQNLMSYHHGMVVNSIELVPTCWTASYKDAYHGLEK